jgi:hypothetical protein
MRYLLALLIVAAGAAQAQQLYRWTDKDGKVQYGQNPPPGVAAKPIKQTTSQVGSQKATTIQRAPGAVVHDDEYKPNHPDPNKQY